MAEDISCVEDTLSSNIECILTYKGDGDFMVVNYSLLVLNMGHCFLKLSSERIECHPKRWKFALLSLLFSVVFQISLCLMVRCSGISIVWCAIVGWILFHSTPTNSESGARVHRLKMMEWIILIVNVSVIIYYAVVLPVITTVAHLLAIVMGVVLAKWEAWMLPETAAHEQERRASGTPLITEQD